MPLLYFEVYCANCGKGLCNMTTVDESKGIKVEVKPCPDCMKEAESDGFEKGFSRGSKLICDHANSIS